MDGRRTIISLQPTYLLWLALFLLRLFGADIGHNVHIYNTAVVYNTLEFTGKRLGQIGEYAFVYNLGKITIGKKILFLIEPIFAQDSLLFQVTLPLRSCRFKLVTRHGYVLTVSLVPE